MERTPGSKENPARLPWLYVCLIGVVLLSLVVTACSVRTPAPVASPSATEAATPTFLPTTSPAVTPLASPVPTGKPPAAWRNALRAANNGDCVNAIPMLKEVIPELRPEEADDARYRLGACYALTGKWGEALQWWQSVSRGSKWRAPSSFLSGEALLHAGRLHESRNAFVSYLAASHTITDVVWANVAAAYAAEGKMGKAKGMWRRAVDAAPDAYARVTLREREIDILERSGLYEDAAAQYRAILADARNKKYRTEVWQRLGDALQNAEKPEEAEKAWLQAVSGDEESPHAYTALTELVEMGAPVDDYHRGIINYAHGVYVLAIEALTHYLTSGQEEHTDDARIYLAKAQGAEGRPDRSEKVLRPLLESPPSSLRFQKGMQALADAYVKAGHWQSAHKVLLELSSEAVSPEVRAEALWQAGKIALEHRDFLHASSDISQMVEKYPDSSITPRGLFVLGLGAYRFGLFPAATSALQVLQDRYPEFSPEQVHFWLGQAASKSGRIDLARREWGAISAGHSYYSVMARKQGKSLGIPLPTPVPPDAGCSDEPLPKMPVTGRAWRRGKALLEVGLREDAYRAFREARAAYWDDPESCAGAAARLASLGEYNISVSCALHALATWKGSPPCALYRLAYPAYYGDIVLGEAHTEKIDPFLVLALIRQESYFSAYARSSAGAQGLMQLMPATARWVASKSGGSDPSDKLLLPNLNIHLGVVFLKMNLDYFKGVANALAAYNAGYGRVVRWRSLYGDDEVLLAEAMPIEETREYVKQVVAQEEYYRQLYRGVFPEPVPCSGEEGLLPIGGK